MDHAPEYVPQIEEVASVIEVPLSHLSDPALKTKRTLTLAEGFDEIVPGYMVDGHFLWGATAMMSSELEEILARI